MRAYALQDEGLDTVDANTTLGFDDDERDYGIAARMLQKLGCTRVYLMTNNPAKLDGLSGLGIEVVGRMPLHAPINAHNRRYMTAKAMRAGHKLDHLMAALAAESEAQSAVRAAEEVTEEVEMMHSASGPIARSGRFRLGGRWTGLRCLHADRARAALDHGAARHRPDPGRNPDGQYGERPAAGPPVQSASLDRHPAPAARDHPAALSLDASAASAAARTCRRCSAWSPEACIGASMGC